MKSPTLNALTFDVEDFFHVHGFADVISRSQWDDFPRRVADSTRLILRRLSQFDVRATFFVLGWVADREPDLIREIADNGHELACHGYWHRAVFDQTPDEFMDDVEQSLAAIRKAVPGSVVLGYRAPTFSIVARSLWALDILEKLGLRYDSSIFPCRGHDRYGVPDGCRTAHRVREHLWEIPLSTYRLFRVNLPVAGGGYFRLYPSFLTRLAIRRLNASGIPAVVYLHPWEFDVDQPVVTQAGRQSRFRHYVNIGKTERRFCRLLRDFHFAPICDVFASELALIDNERNRSLRFEQLHRGRVSIRTDVATAKVDREYL